MRQNEAAGPTKAAAQEPKVKIDEANWGEDDDSLGSLDDEVEAQAATEPAAGGDSGAAVEEPEIFVPPAPGADPYSTLLR